MSKRGKKGFYWSPFFRGRVMLLFRMQKQATFHLLRYLFGFFRRHAAPATALNGQRNNGRRPGILDYQHKPPAIPVKTLILLPPFKSELHFSEQWFHGNLERGRETAERLLLENSHLGDGTFIVRKSQVYKIQVTSFSKSYLIKKCFF